MSHKLNSDEEHNLKEAAARHFEKKVPAESPSDIDRLISRWKVDIAAVQGMAAAIDSSAIPNGTHTKENFTRSVEKMFLERSLQYNKDELQLLLSVMCAQAVVSNYF